MALDPGMITPYLGLSLVVLILVYMIKLSRIKKYEASLETRQLETFIDRGYLDLFDDDHHDILYLAATKGVADLTAKALEKGADPNRLYRGKNLLHVLAKDHLDDTASALALLKGGALADGSEGVKITPLWQSAFSDNPELSRLLIDYGADLNFKAHTFGTTPLMAAVFKGSVSVGQVLVDEGADLFLFDEKGRQAKDFAHTKDTDIPLATHRAARISAQKHIHDYKELIRQIFNLMQGKPYEYAPFT
ncbi:MAG: hypothetical protein HUN05_14435 [Desulfobacter sp.]|nr:MAG: hypothetical protein HUN05_14435 [Desulfobacter sp.]